MSDDHKPLLFNMENVRNTYNKQRGYLIIHRKGLSKNKEWYNSFILVIEHYGQINSMAFSFT